MTPEKWIKKLRELTQGVDLTIATKVLVWNGYKGAMK